MSSAHLAITFPDKAALAAFLANHPFTKDPDIQKANIISIAAKTFANQRVCNLKKAVIAMLDQHHIAPYECGLEKYLFVESILSALTECASTEVCLSSRI